MFLGRVQKHIGQVVGSTGDPVHALGRVGRWAGRRHSGHLAHEPEHAVGQPPRFAHALTQRFVGDAEHGFGCALLVRVVGPGHRLAHLGGFVRQVELCEHAPQVLEQRTQKDLLTLAQVWGPQVGCKRRRQQRAQVFAFELRRVRFVFHVVEQHQAHGNVADARETDQADRARHRVDVASPHVAEVRGVDDAQHLVGQRHVLEDFVGQAVDVFVLGRSEVLDPQDLLRHGREIGGAPHAPQQEIQRGVGGRVGWAACRRVVGCFNPAVECFGHVGCGSKPHFGVACQGAVHQCPQVVVHRTGRVQGQHQVFMGHPVDGAVGVCFGHQRTAQQHFGQHQARAEHVADRTWWLPPGAFRREVAGCPGHAGHGLCQLTGWRAVHAQRQAEVGHFGMALLAQQDVGRLEVSVHHPLPVCGLEGCQHLGHDGHRPTGCQRSASLELLRQ